MSFGRTIIATFLSLMLKTAVEPTLPLTSHPKPMSRENDEPHTALHALAKLPPKATPDHTRIHDDEHQVAPQEPVDQRTSGYQISHNLPSPSGIVSTSQPYGSVKTTLRCLAIARAIRPQCRSAHPGTNGTPPFFICRGGTRTDTRMGARLLRTASLLPFRALTDSPTALR